MPRYKITAKAFKNFTGAWPARDFDGHIHFVDGISEDLTIAQIDRLAAALGGEIVNDAGETIARAGIFYRLKALAAGVVMPVDPPEPEVPAVTPFSFPLKGARYHLDFAGMQYHGGIQPDDTSNANDGRFFREVVSLALPAYAENADGSLRRFATGTPLRRSTRGLLIEPVVEYVSRILWSNDLTNALWIKDGITAVKNQASRSDVANSATRITATKDGATVLYPMTLAESTRNLYADIRRAVGTGKISMTMDGGATWTDITLDKPRYNGWGRYSLPLRTITDPSCGFKIEKSGDAFDIAFVTSDYSEYEMSPFDTTGTVRRRTYDRPSTSLQGGTTTSVSSGLMEFLAASQNWGIFMEWDSQKPSHFLFGQILRPFEDGSMRFSTDDTDVKAVTTPAGLVRRTVDPTKPLTNKAVAWCKDGVAYISVNGSQVYSKSVGAGPYTALDHKDLGSNGAGSVNMAGYIKHLAILETIPTAEEAMAWSAI